MRSADMIFCIMSDDKVCPASVTTIDSVLYVDSVFLILRVEAPICWLFEEI